MIREYINQLLSETIADIGKLEKQMSNLMSELKENQEWLCTLEKEASLDTNIFSPRNRDYNIDEKIEKVNTAIQNQKNHIEHTRELIEEHIRKKQEYESLLLEIDDSERNVNTEVSNMMDESKYIDKETVADFLNDLYRKLEICLATVNSDKNRCKNELKGLKNAVKSFAGKIENR